MKKIEQEIAAEMKQGEQMNLQGEGMAELTQATAQATAQNEMQEVAQAVPSKDELKISGRTVANKPSKPKQEGRYRLRYHICFKVLAFIMVLLGIYVASITSMYLFIGNSVGGFFTVGTRAVQTLVEGSYGDGYYVLLNLNLAVFVLLLALWYLFCAAGHTPRSSQFMVKGWAKLPLDFLTILVAGAFGTIFCLGMLALNAIRWSAWDWQIFWLSIALFATSGAVLLLYFLNIAVRCKTRTLVKNTIVYRVLAFAYRLLKKAVLWLAAAVGQLFAQLPFIWKGVVLLPALVLFNLILLWVCIVPFHWAGTLYLFLTGVQVLCIVSGYLYFLLALNRLAAGGRALATGDLTYQVDTKHLYFELKEHAENINQMRGCLNQAVNAQMKSERMKTELITNVSHDIKTPLTSIINYTDLLSKESDNHEKIAEYTEVIVRQSERLKRLLEDLVEASKASTGNLEMNLAQCEVGVLLSQMVGEYEQRLQAQSLTLLVKQPEQPIYIMADGRRLWRVFDNLMNNIVKYAQGGTRVYITLAQQGAQAVITLKNISAYPLDISAEELMERFVRGDASRHNEGNGLGLSIAQSLTELQRGSLTLCIDGDLFKVTLTFPLQGGPVQVAE